MALQKPKFHMPSAAESQQFVDSDAKFISIKDGESVTMRFLPPPVGYPSIFVPVTNHHGLKNQDGKNVAIACLEKHGNAETGKACLLCWAANVLKGTGDKADAKLADEFRQKGARFYTQVLRALTRRKEFGKGTEIYGWTGPKFWQASGTTQGKLQVLMNKMESDGDALYFDPVEGQALVLTRTGAGFDTDYMVERTSQVVSLDEIRPDWADQFTEDIYGALKLNVMGWDEQLAHLRATLPGTDWDAVLAGTPFGGTDEEA
jgi:hypothetical protein